MLIYPLCVTIITITILDMDSGRVIYGTDAYMNDVSAVVQSEVENLLRWSANEHSSQEEYRNESEYNLNHPYRGLAVVISNGTFDRQNPRQYAHKDIEKMTSAFTSMGLMVLKFKDLTAKQMHEVLNSVASLEECHAKSAMFACAIGSHGEEVEVKKKSSSGVYTEHDHLIHGTDYPIPTKYLVNLFSNSRCNNLKGKPKLFFIQACRNHYGQASIDSGVPVHTKLHDVIGNREHIHCREDESEKAEESLLCEQSGDSTIEGWREKFKNLCSVVKRKESRGDISAVCPNHFCVLYATAPGRYALGRKNEGGWMFMKVSKALKEAFCALKRHDVSEIDFLQTLTVSIKEVALTMKAKSPKQDEMDNEPSYIYTAPCIEHRLARNIVFRKHSP